MKAMQLQAIGLQDMYLILQWRDQYSMEIFFFAPDNIHASAPAEIEIYAIELNIYIYIECTKYES
jgi:hypothetical protein